MQCDRCGGLKIEEYFCGASVTAGAWSYDGYRCVNCGAIFFSESDADPEQVFMCGNYRDTS